MALLLSILGVLLFIGLILVHEYGHYKVAIRNGVKVEEFGLGLPPRAWGKKLKSGMLLSLNWLPLGGFVRLKGETDSDTREGSFGAASMWVKTKIMLAGVAMNLITALVLFTLLALIGLPTIFNKQTLGQDQFTVSSDERIARQDLKVGYVEPESPADRAGLAPLDTLIAYGDSPCKTGGCTPFTTADALLATTKSFAGQQLHVQYERDGQTYFSNAMLRTEAEVAASRNTDNPKGYLGLAPTEFVVKRYTWSAPVVAAGLTAQLTQLTFQGIGKAFAGIGSALAGLVTSNQEARVNGQTQASEQVGGPVAIFKILFDSGSLGINFILLLIALLSLTLAIMNALPIPALDGGRLFVTWLFRIIKKPLTKPLEERIHGTGMAVLLSLFVLITYLDIKRFF